eukprot:m.669806 g.669806  ORF g.669806 m.669806 type:complete len:51 (+) comp22765_c0_seq9:2586-2738(+)
MAAERVDTFGSEEGSLKVLEAWRTSILTDCTKITNTDTKSVHKLRKSIAE